MESAPLAPPAPEPDDFALMASVKAGDDVAFGVLSLRWRARLVNFFRGMGADPEGAEDCAQETLLRVFRYRREYRPDRPFPSFLFTLARHAFVDSRRRAARWRRERSLDDEDGGGIAEAVADPRSGAVAARMEQVDLLAAVARLPRRLRDVVELGAIRGLPYERVATLLGVPVGTVKSRMHHAVRRLKESLDSRRGRDRA